MAIVYLGLGSNLGDREKNIQDAVTLLQQNQFVVERLSSIIETDPVGFLEQGKFLNAVMKGRTVLSAFELFDLTQSIEKQIGRKKIFVNGPRIIDIDILLYDKQKINTPHLNIPHPRMWERDFVMRPLKEVEPELFAESFL